MLFDWKKLFSPEYLADPRPPHVFFAFGPLLVAFVATIAIAIVLPYLRWQPWQKSFVGRLTTPLWTLGLGGLAYLFFRNQSIPFLSSRWLLILLMLVFLVWIGYIIAVAPRKIEGERISFERAERLKKYLPKPKR